MGNPKKPPTTDKKPAYDQSYNQGEYDIALRPAPVGYPTVPELEGDSFFGTGNSINQNNGKPPKK